MKSIIISLLLYISMDPVNGHVQFNRNESIENETNHLVSIQKELPDANLYRKTGHWIMRATSDLGFTLTRVQFTLQNDKVNVHEYIGQKRIFSGVLSHIGENKVLQLDSSDGQQRNIVSLYQDDKILINLIVIKDRQVLTVLVKASQTSSIENNDIRNVISNSVLNKPNVRSLVEELVDRLVFVNENLQPINYPLEDPDYHLNIGDYDLVDCDLSKSIGNWTLKAISADKFRHFTDAEVHLNGDQVVIDYSSSAGKDLSVTFNYMGSSRVIRVDMYGHKKYGFGYGGLIYVDAIQFIAVGKTSVDAEMLAAYCRGGYTCDNGYLKGIIDNLLLFTQDVKREIKEMVPKMTWR